MRGMSKRLNLCLLLVSAWLAATAAAGSEDNEKAQVFEGLEQKHADSPGYLELTKASWLTKRGNSYVEKGELDNAIDSFEEAIGIRRDYFPAYVSLALAYLVKERYSRAIETIERAPTTMNFSGNELGGFEYDVYYVKMLVYAGIPNHEQGLESAREGIEVLDDPRIREQRERAEKAGVAGPGSGRKIVELLEKYVKIQESRLNN